MEQAVLVTASNARQVYSNVRSMLRRGDWTILGCPDVDSEIVEHEVFDRQRLEEIYFDGKEIRFVFTEKPISLPVGIAHIAKIELGEKYVRMAIPCKGEDGHWYVREWLIFPHNS